MRKLFSPAWIGMLSLILGFSGAGYAQEPPHQPEPKPEPKAEPNHQAEPKHEEGAKPPHQEEAKPPRQEDVKPPKHDEPKQHPEDARQEHPDQKHPENHPEQNAGPQHQGRPAGQSAHIPDDRFREHFGRQHTVVIRQPVIVEGRPRFQYSGYWFVISDPWPAEWAYTDDCYIDYIDGEYFLFDVLHPGIRIALFVQM